MHTSGNLIAMARAGFGLGAPQMAPSISESSLLEMERGRNKPAGKQCGFQEQDANLWSL